MEVDKQQFIRIIEKNDDRLRHLCKVYVSNSSDEKDLYQEIIIHIWRSLPSFEGEAKLSTWIYRLAVNTAISMKRKRQTRRKYHKAYKNEVDRENRSNSEHQGDDQQIQELYAAIGRLGTVEKMIITMYLEEFSYKEIAYVTGITENYVGVKLNRIKKKLSQIMKAYYGV